MEPNQRTHQVTNAQLTDPEFVMGGDPSGVLLPGVNPNQRKIQFNIISPNHDNSLTHQWDGRPVWMITHGWNSNADNFAELANTVQQAIAADGIVLTLDWREAANTGTNLLTQDNGKAASWIKAVADSAVDKLKTWGLTDGSKINLIGHSLGSLLNTEIADRFTRNDNQRGVNSIIALEPPSQANIWGGYDLDGSTAGIQSPQPLNRVARFSRAFVGSRSNAASAKLAGTAHESILMDFGDRFDFGEEHGWVIDTFTRLIDTRQTQLTGDPIPLFSLADQGLHPEFQPDSFTGNFITTPVFEGVIRVNQPNRVISFKARANDGDADANADDEIIYGTNRDDWLEGGMGDDTLIGGDGNDTLIGDIGTDSLTGGTGSDRFVFGTNRAFRANKIGDDTVTDFVRRTDILVLDKSTFRDLVSIAGNALDANEFGIIHAPTNGAAIAGNPNQAAKIVFNQSNGELFYNQNGSTAGLGTGGLFARLSGVTLLASHDFVIQA